MKKTILLVLVLITSFFTGCNKDLSWLFSDNAPGVVSSVDVLPEGFSNDFFHSNEFKVLARPVLTEVFDLPEGNWYRVEEGAIVINDPAMLQDVYSMAMDVTYKWPEIDFEKYSLVLGLVFNPNGDYSRAYLLKQQRAVAGIGGVKIYYSFIEVTGDYGVVAEAPTPMIVGALFPKLPDGIAKVVTWLDPSETIDIDDLM